MDAFISAELSLSRLPQKTKLSNICIYTALCILNQKIISEYILRILAYADPLIPIQAHSDLFRHPSFHLCHADKEKPMSHSLRSVVFLLKPSIHIKWFRIINTYSCKKQIYELEYISYLMHRNEHRESRKRKARGTVFQIKRARFIYRNCA